jgi:hypothetical protein
MSCLSYISRGLYIGPKTTLSPPPALFKDDTSVADPEPLDTDPDPAFHFDTDPDHAFNFDTDPNPAFQFDKNPEILYGSGSLPFKEVMYLTQYFLHTFT